MPDRPGWVRFSLALLLILIGLVQAQALLQTVRARTRLRDRVLAAVTTAWAGIRPRVELVLSPGGARAEGEALREALLAQGAAEAELFEWTGQRVSAQPRPTPVQHWPAPSELALLRTGRPHTVGPVHGESSRLLTYAPVMSGDRSLLLRIGFTTPDLLDDLDERRQLLIAHVAGLMVLVVAAAVLLFPNPAPDTAGGPRGMEAYAAAMERLRAHGEAESQRHRAERDRLEDEVHEKDALARAGELTAGMVHEVRNGLGTILGYARLLERQGTPEVAEAAERIRAECETLEVVVRRFMDFVRRETLDVAELDLHRMLSRVVARESQAEGAPVRLPTGDAPRVRGDEELLERAFENLVRNAREAAGPSGHVEVAVARDEAGVSVTIEDDGPGLPPELAQGPRPFVTTKPGGLGLGLAMTQKIIRLHQGSLRLGGRESRRGTRVIVELPALPVTTSNVEPPSMEPATEPSGMANRQESKV